MNPFSFSSPFQGFNGGIQIPNLPQLGVGQLPNQQVQGPQVHPMNPNISPVAPGAPAPGSGNLEQLMGMLQNPDIMSLLGGQQPEALPAPGLIMPDPGSVQQFQPTQLSGPISRGIGSGLFGGGNIRAQ